MSLLTNFEDVGDYLDWEVRETWFVNKKNNSIIIFFITVVLQRSVFLQLIQLLSAPPHRLTPTRIKLSLIVISFDPFELLHMIVF